MPTKTHSFTASHTHTHTHTHTVHLPPGPLHRSLAPSGQRHLDVPGDKVTPALTHQRKRIIVRQYCDKRVCCWGCKQKSNLSFGLGNDGSVSFCRWWHVCYCDAITMLFKHNNHDIQLELKTTIVQILYYGIVNWWFKNIFMSPQINIIQTLFRVLNFYECRRYAH